MQSSTPRRYLASHALVPRPICHAPGQKHLAIELIAEILSYLTSHRDIFAALSTSQQFRAIMLPKVYKEVYLSTDDPVKILAAFSACIDAPCTRRKSCGEQVESLTLYTHKESNIGDLCKFVSPLYHLLVKLTNLAELVLHIPSVTLYSDTWLEPADIDLRTQLPLRVLRLFPPRVRKSQSDREMSTSPSPLVEWLSAQRSIERVEYEPWEPSPFRFGPEAFMGLRALSVEAKNLAMVGGMARARPLTHLKVKSKLSQAEVFRRGPPQALRNVTALTHDGLDLVDMFPHLERVDIEYYYGVWDGDLVWLLEQLRWYGQSRKGNMQRVRFLRLWGMFVLTDEGKRALVKVFKKLAGLECVEVLRDDVTSTRYARDGSSQAVRWRCEEDDVWYHDWEKDVTIVDDEAPLVYANPWMILSPPQSLE
ncbi:hypothetical protein EYR38_008303 [Pleurotus pulmonarius]|nr:hypothetical protein EYR38_008303 [Pleurotus pulmonarius]